MDRRQDFAVRPAREDDRERLETLWTSFMDEQSELDSNFVVSDDALERWNNDFATWVAANVHALFVAEGNGDLIGFASAHLWFPAPIYEQRLEVYLNELYVVSAWRRRGVARALVNRIESWAHERKARRIRLGVLSANVDGVSFWRSTGAEPFVETMVIELKPTGGFTEAQIDL